MKIKMKTKNNHLQHLHGRNETKRKRNEKKNNKKKFENKGQESLACSPKNKKNKLKQIFLVNWLVTQIFRTRF